jgi:ubiquinone biosynthesis protein
VTLFSIKQNRQALDRVARIMEVLAKYQFGQFTDRVRLGEKLNVRILKRKPPKELIYKTPPERVRMALEELGTTFVKFGQLLSTREDIVGAEYAEELSKLQDSMHPFSAAEAKKVIEEEFHKPISDIFASFEPEPFASASIAQAHRARLKSGKRVVVKVQRPGIEDTVKEDIRIMHYLSHVTSKYIPEVHDYDPIYLVKEFERSIMKELDFIREMKSAQHLKRNFEGDENVYIPAVYEELCTKRVITIEEARGTRLSDIVKSSSTKFDKKLIAHRCADAFFKMVMEDGFYHEDLHPGNIIVMDKNVICLLDFGRVGSIDKEVAENIFRLAGFAITDDVRGMVSHLLRTNILSESANIGSLKEDLSDLLDKYYTPKTSEIKIGQMLSDLVSVLGRYEFNRPREIAELTSSLFILEGMCLRLDPKFNIITEFEPYARKVMAEGFSVRKFEDDLKDGLLDVQYLAKDFPTTVRRFFKKLDDGKLRIELAHRDLDILTEELDRISDKLSMALIFAALIVGSSLIVQANAFLGILVFIMSSVIGILLMLRTVFVEDRDHEHF